MYRQAGSDVGTSYTVVDVNGTRLMPAKELMFPTGYAWDPGGTKVVFTGRSINATGNGAVAFYLFDTSLGESPKVIAKYKKTVVQDLAWSPDGSTIAWAEWDTGKYRSGNLYLMSPSGGDSKRLADLALMPAWAPGATVSSLPHRARLREGAKRRDGLVKSRTSLPEFPGGFRMRSGVESPLHLG